MAKVETKQEQAPAAAEGEAKQEASVKVRILKTGTEIDGWRFAAGSPNKPRNLPPTRQPSACINT